MRRAISCQASWATRASNEPNTNSHRPNCAVRLAPKRECAQAANNRPAVMAARKPVDNHCACGRPIEKSSMIAGRATLMLVEASTMAMLPIIRMPSNQRG